ncbi:MAG: hypothetical protein ABI776_04545 [Nocardioidaceae bacterium]
MAAATTPRPSTPARTSAGPVYSALIGLVALAVLLQGLSAGIFLEHDGRRDAASGWIDLHAGVADLGILLGILATVYAVATLRSRRDLVVGTLVLTVLMVVETVLGGLIRDHHKDTLTAVHVPLAMALMALVVWLPMRAVRRD